MWVADTSDDKLYAYSMSDKTHDPSKDFILTAENTDPSGIWSDGTTMWVADTSTDKLYAYDGRELMNTNSLNSVLRRVVEIATPSPPTLSSPT